METSRENINNNRCFRKQLSENFADNQQEDDDVIFVGADTSQRKYANKNILGANEVVQNVKNEISHTKKRCDEPIIDLTFTSNLHKEMPVVSGGINGGISNYHGRLENFISTSQTPGLNNGKPQIPSSSASTRIAEIIKAEHFMATAYVPKKRGRKRKSAHINSNVKNFQIPLENIDINAVNVENGEYLENSDSKQTEVLKAAKSLFSKRTRTLYHWMYPNAPKQQLKAAVAMSWETLGTQEKEFYISQVLGRFGFPQCSLMVNPQLGGINGVPNLTNLNLPNPTVQNQEETKTAVSSILLGVSNDESNWTSGASHTIYQNSHEQKNLKKKKRLGRPPGSKNKKQVKDENLKIVSEENVNDDFKDDPELSRELEQFKWTLHLNVSK